MLLPHAHAWRFGCVPLKLDGVGWIRCPASNREICRGFFVTPIPGAVSIRYSIGFVLLAAGPAIAQVGSLFPAFFIPNAGQADASLRYVVDSPGLHAGFANTSAVFQLDRLLLRVEFLGANPNTSIEGGQRLNAAANFLIGNRAEEWKTDLPVYQKIRGVCS